MKGGEILKIMEKVTFEKSHIIAKQGKYLKSVNSINFNDHIVKQKR